MPLPRFVTRAKMLWDDENLYVAADLAGDEIWGHLTERDSVIYFDNDFEIFVDPDSDTYHYYEFEMNVLNTVWDLFLAEPYRDGGSGLNGYDMHGFAPLSMWTVPSTILPLKTKAGVLRL